MYQTNISFEFQYARNNELAIIIDFENKMNQGVVRDT